MSKVKVRKRKQVSDDDTNRFRILFALFNEDRPLKVSEIWKKAGLSEQIVSHHLKNMKKEYLVLEHPDKTYSCQPFFYNNIQMENLYNLMEIIIRTIFSDIAYPEDASQKEIEKIIMGNLGLFIRFFGIKLVGE